MSVLGFALRHRSAFQFFLHLLILGMFMSVLCSVIEVLFSFFKFVSFSNVHVCFVFRDRSVVQFFCICCVERNFFSLAVFSGNILAGDAHSSVTVDRQHLSAHLKSEPVLSFSYYSYIKTNRTFFCIFFFSIYKNED